MAALGVRIDVTRLCEDAWEITPAGELDLHDAPALLDALEAVRGGGARRVLLDLSSVPFVDSTILGVLSAASKRFETLVLAAGDLRVLRVLRITGLDRTVLVERSRSEALELLSARRAA